MRPRAMTLAVALLAMGGACRSAHSSGGADSAGAPDGRLGLGHAASPQAIAALDIDVDTAGSGLPKGHGDALRGEAIFHTQCAPCHGPKGQGTPPVYPALIGHDPQPGFAFASDFRLTKTIGNYWPYATTLYDYIRRAMPFTAPGSLSAEDTYSVTAYLLAANDVLPAGATLDSASLVAVKMPARNRFVPDDRHGGHEIR